MRIVGTPFSSRAAITGSEPPTRSSSGRAPITRSNASWPSWIAGSSGRTSAAGRSPELDLDVGAFGRGLPHEPLHLRRDRLVVLTGHEADRDVRLRLDRKHRLLETSARRREAVHVDGGLDPGAEVELLGRARVGRASALPSRGLGARSSSLQLAISSSLGLIIPA